MGTVRYVAFRGKSWISKLIRFVTRSKKYSHIGFLSANGELIECWPSRKNPFQRWCFSSFDNHRKGTSYEIWELAVPNETVFWIEEFFHDTARTGVMYDWLGVVGFVFKLVRDSSDRLFCSEGCMTPLVKYLGWDNINPSHVSPQDFIEIIQAAGARMIKADVV